MPAATSLIDAEVASQIQAGFVVREIISAGSSATVARNLTSRG